MKFSQADIHKWDWRIAMAMCYICVGTMSYLFSRCVVVVRPLAAAGIAVAVSQGVMGAVYLTCMEIVIVVEEAERCIKWLKRLGRWYWRS